MARTIFTDSWNSAAHALLGYIAGEYSSLLLIVLFEYYQFVLSDKENAVVDSAEFAIGYLISKYM